MDAPATENLDHLSIAVFVVDAQATITVVNQAAVTLCGRPHAALLGAALWAVLEEVLGTAAPPAMVQAQHPVAIDAFAPRLQRWLALSADPFGTGLVIIVEDITARTQAELERARVLTELDESRRLFERITETCPDALYVYDLATGHSTYINARSAQVYGYTPDEVAALGARFATTLWHPDDLPSLPEHRRRLRDLADGEIDESEFRVRQPDGSYRWLRARTSVFARGDDGQVRQIVIAAQDISAHKQAEAALHAQERFVQQVAALTPVVISVFDLVTQRDTYISPDVETLLGYTPAEIAHLDGAFATLWHPDDRDTARAHLARVQASADGVVSEQDYQARHRDGTWHWLRTRSLPFARDERGAVVQLVTATLDITDQRQAERERRRHQELLQTIFDHIPVMIRFLDADGRLQFINRTYAATLGWSLTELQHPAHDMFASFYPDLSERQRMLHHIAAATGTWADFITRTRDGGVLATSWAHIRLADGTAIGIGQDITARKRAEDALREREQQLAAQSRFLEATLSALPDVVSAFDREHRLVYVNRAMQALVGRTASEMLGKRFADLAYPSDLAARLTDHLDTIFRTGETIEDEDSYSSPTGVTAFFTFRWGPVRAADGSVELVVGVSRDTTERRRLADRLRASEERQAFLLRLSDQLRPLADPLAVQARASQSLGEYLHVSRVAYGEVANDGSHIRIARNYVAPGVPLVTGQFRMADFGSTLLATLSAARTIAVPDLADADELAARERAAYAELGIGALVGVPLTKGGRLVATLIVHHAAPRPWMPPEITLIEEVAERTWAAVERARVEAALRESEERFRRIFELGLIGMAITSPTKGILDVNDELCRILGYARSELVGMTWEPFTHPNDRAADAAQFTRVLAGEIDGYTLDKQWIRKDGRVIDSTIAVKSLRREDGSVEYFVALLHDITERKRGEKALRRMRDDLEVQVAERTRELTDRNEQLRLEIAERKHAEHARQVLQQQLVGTEEEERRHLARELHDSLGQHLTALHLGFKAVQARATCPADVADSIQQLREQALRIDEAVDRLVIQLRPPALDDLGLAAAVRQLAKEWTATSGIPVEVHTRGLDHERVPTFLETTVYRVVQAALTNVLKHAHATRVSLIVERRTEELLAIVEDDGRGFDLEAVRHVPGTRPQLGITGMRERAALVDGRVDIETAPGAGTTVYLHVPLAAPSDGGGSAGDE